MNKLSAFLVVSRAKLLVGSVGHATLGLILGASTAGSLLSRWTLLYVVMHFSIAFLACAVNSICDYEVDQRSRPELSSALDRLGRGTALRAVAVEATIAVAAIVVFFANGFVVAPAAACFGLFVAFAYSAEPLRIKRRGIWSPIPLWLALYTVPIVAGWSVFRSDVPVWLVVFVVGYSCMNEGITLVNTAEDHSEDAAEGISTWSHVFGPQVVLRLAPALTLLGVLCPIAMLARSDDIVAVSSLVLVVAAAAIVRVAFEVDAPRREGDGEAAAKRHGRRLARWFVSARYPLIAAGLLQAAAW